MWEPWAGSLQRKKMTLSPAINGGLCPQMTIIDRDLWLQVLKAYHQHATKKCDPGTSRILPPQTLPGREVQHAVHRVCLCFGGGLQPGCSWLLRSLMSVLKSLLWWAPGWQWPDLLLLTQTFREKKGRREASSEATN